MAANFEIILLPDARKDLRRMRKYDATRALDCMEQILRHSPAAISRSRIKRLRGPQPADYRLRAGDFRVFYRIVEQEVHVARVLSKEQTSEFYRRDI